MYEDFEKTHIIHDYMLFDGDRHLFAVIASTEAKLESNVKMVYNARRSVFKAIGLDMPKKIIAHQTYVDKEFTFDF